MSIIKLIKSKVKVTKLPKKQPSEMY